MIFSYRNSISIFLLTSFLLLRVVNVHALYHDLSDDDQHCELCAIVAQADQSVPLDSATSYPDLFVQHFVGIKTQDNFQLYTAPYPIVLHSDYFYNKPPPDPLLG